MDGYLNEKLQLLKEEYEKPHMSKEQLAKLRVKMKEAKMTDRKEHNKARMIKYAMAAAVFVGVFLILPNTSDSIAQAMVQIPILGRFVEVVTIRDYQYDTDRNSADINVPELKLEEQVEDGQLKENLKQTTDEINTEIQRVTDDLIEHFEAYLEDEKGYQDIIVKSEVLATTPDYFTLKLFCFQGAGSSYQWNYYYTIDLNTGERLQLKDIFADGADYITPISDNIKKQMQEQMADDDTVSYWLDNEIEEWNFKTIDDETSFYLNENGNVVICFDEGDVAPMYMGAVEFEIPAEVLSNIRK